MDPVPLFLAGHHGAGGEVTEAGHTGYVKAVATTQLDERPVVVSGSADHTVRVSDLATGRPVGSPFTGHTKQVNARWRPRS